MTTRKTAATPAKKKTTSTRTRKKPVEKAPIEEQDPRGKYANYLPLTDEERYAVLNAYQSLTSAGLPVPHEIQSQVDIWIEEENARRTEVQKAQEVEQAQIQKEDDEGPLWVRNCFNGPFSLPLKSLSENKIKKLELKPRGKRGDMHQLDDLDEKDPNLAMNVERGFIEIIPNGQAKRIIAKQTQNIGQNVHYPLAILTNEKGEALQRVRTEIEFSQQGVTVAYNDPNIGEQHENVKWNGPNSAMGGLTRNQPQQQVSHFIPTGGNPAIVSNGFASQEASMGAVTAQNKIADDIARRKTQGRPEDTLGLSVTIAPTEKS